ncbi:MAG: hypothetical protein QOG65_2925 [Actinomycetota bacterium]|jgi:hypothetical protein|nr:hypothetical protein [Actinomycetota bacterium]MDQ1385546.1 hypothetical protein [Actinomycetota bacterium]
MSLTKWVPAWIHGVGDYGAGLALVIVTLAVGGTRRAVATGLVVGIALLAVSLVTRYPLGAVKAIPFRVHSAGDYLGSLLLIVAPFVLGFHSRDEGLTAFFIAVGVVVILLSLVTDYDDPALTVREDMGSPRRLQGTRR